MWKKFEAYLTYEKQYAAQSIRAYHHDLHQFRSYLINRDIDIFSESAVSKVRSRDLRAWMGELVRQGLAYRSVARKISAIKSYFQFLLKSDIIHVNPARLIKVPAYAQKLPVFLKVAETEALFENVEFEASFQGSRDRCILEMLYGCGLRRSELIGLKAEDVDVYQQHLRVSGKGKKERIVPFGRHLLQAILHYRDEAHKAGLALEDFFFVRPNGKALYPKLVYRLVHKYVSQISLVAQKSPHVLRHTFATHMLENGADLNAIKELLGHNSLAATQVYTHNTIGKLKKVHIQAHPRASTLKSDSL